MRALLISLAFLVAASFPATALAEAPTERYAPAQLGVAQMMLERARAAALRGNAALAGRLAWQASLDARLAWAMTESELLRAQAAQVGNAARVLVTRLARQ